MFRRVKIDSVLWTRPSFSDRIVHGVFAAYVMIALVPFIYAASRPRFYNSQVEPGAALLYITVLVALWRKRRWAWYVLGSVDCYVVASYAWSGGSAVFVVTNVIALALLLSPPMRQYVGHVIPKMATEHRPPTEGPRL